MCGYRGPRGWGTPPRTGPPPPGGPPLPGTQHFFVVCSPDPRLQCPAPLATGLTMLLMVCWHRAQLCSNLCLHGRLRIVHDATTGHSSNHSHELTVSLGNLVLHMPTWALPLQRQRRCPKRVGEEVSSSATAVPMGWDLVRTHTLRCVAPHHAGAVGPTYGAGSWLSAASLTEAGLRVLEKKSAVVQLLFQWVGTWCVHTLQYVALSDTMQERWDLCRARGCGYRQVRVPGASGDTVAAAPPPASSPVLDSPSAPKHWQQVAPRRYRGARRACSGASLVA